MSWAQKYLHIPFVDYGRDPLGCDCFGLVALILTSELGLKLSTFPEIGPCDYDQIENTIAAEVVARKAVAIARAQEFDVVVLRGRVNINGRVVSAPIHLGLVTDAHEIIHTQKGTGVVCVPLSHMSIKSRIVGVYRPC